MTPAQIFRAGRVRRWHTNPDMSDTPDYIDGHSARVARLMLHFWPDTGAAALRAALTHDDGEHALADIAGPTKATLPPEIQAALDQIETEARERLWGPDPDLTPDELLRLDFCDKLDAFMWVAQNRPYLLHAREWRKAREALEGRAVALGVALGGIGRSSA